MGRRARKRARNETFEQRQARIYRERTREALTMYVWGCDPYADSLVKAIEAVNLTLDSAR